MHPWRPLAMTDREVYRTLATAFYNTDAVIKPIPLSHIDATFEELMRRDTYTSAYVCDVDGAVRGYALLAKTFSQEAGGQVLWIEELYLTKEYRYQGLGRRFFEALLASLPPEIKRVRLEVEKENEGAVRLYESLGFSFLEYDQMVLERS